MNGMKAAKASITKELKQNSGSKNMHGRKPKIVEMCESAVQNAFCAHVLENLDRQKANNYIHIEPYPFPYGSDVHCQEEHE